MKGTESPERGAGTRTDQLFFRRLLESLPAGAYTCDADGLITYYNAQAVRIWGRAPRLNDPVDRYCGSFRLLDAAGRLVRHDGSWTARALRNDTVYEGEEIVVEQPDGNRVPVLVYATPVHDKSGRLIGCVNVLVDISSQKRAEATLRQADRAKDAFLATLAHELRNPLAPVRNATRLLRKQLAGSESSVAAVDLIERQLHLLTRLVDDLLDIGRITSNKISLRKEVVDLQDVLRHAIEISQPLIEDGRHRLHVELGAYPIRVMGDRTRLTQAVSNVLSNAATYTPDGGDIALQLRREEYDAVISVSDSGIGLSAQVLPMVFDLYARAGQDGGQNVLGVGLSLARHVAEMHGGTISALSRGPGEGSEFVFRIPGVLDPAPEEVQPTTTEPTDEPSGGIRVLLVDDNADVLESTRLVLEMMGFIVHAASSGQEALDLGTTFEPDAVLLDIGLPGMDGWATARLMRERSWGKRAKLIAVTGWGRSEDVQKSLEAGFDHHLVKPMDPDELVTLLAAARSTTLSTANVA